jgi:hypothetical protein
MTDAMSMTNENDFPVEFKRLVLLWQDIKTGFFGGENSIDTEWYESGLRTATWAWVPELQKVPPREVDRKGDLLLGPLFCSAENPWPHKDGQPMIPLLQIDLANASRLGGVELGNGLLQVFCPVEDNLGQKIYDRVIERDSVTSEALTDAPSFSDDIKGFASVGWAQTSSNDRRLYGGECLQITGYAEKRFTLWMPSPIADEHDLTDLDPDLRAKIQEFDEIIFINADAWSPGGFHLFGTFYPIQYYPAARDKVFFTLESEHGFNFGEGQAQIFYSFYKDHPEWGAGFSFDWSCY